MDELRVDEDRAEMDYTRRMTADLCNCVGELRVDEDWMMDDYTAMRWMRAMDMRIMSWKDREWI